MVTCDMKGRGKKVTAVGRGLAAKLTVGVCRSGPFERCHSTDTLSSSARAGLALERASVKVLFPVLSLHLKRKTSLASGKTGLTLSPSGISKH